jgi:hypothetical protein
MISVYCKVQNITRSVDRYSQFATSSMSAVHSYLSLRSHHRQYGGSIYDSQTVVRRLFWSSDIVQEMCRKKFVMMDSLYDKIILYYCHKD